MLFLTVVAITALLAATTTGCTGEDPVEANPIYSPAPTDAPFPVLWLGETYDADKDGKDELVLRHGSWTYSPALVDKHGRVLLPEHQFYQVTYAEPCDVSSVLRCPPPVITVKTQPCGTQPISNVAKTGDASLVRGVTAEALAEGSVWIATRDFYIQITVADPDPAVAARAASRVAEEIYGANELAAGYTRDAPFQSPVRIEPAAGELIHPGDIEAKIPSECVRT
jgi:hypothetical protein